eukprot:179251-Prorocentrum_minimum.AAC.1
MSPSFAVASGPCTVTASGCFRSPHYPESYGSDEACTINVLRDNVVLNVMAFDTESGYDDLSVNGVDYSGDITDSPAGVTVNTGTSITWSSDSTVQMAGFEICDT